MARQTIIELTDDLDGSDAVETIAFAFRGITYEIDLNAKNAAAFDKALAKYIEAAHRVGAGRRGVGASRGRSRGGRRSAKRPTDDVGSIREWARANGYQVSARGRISAEIRDAYAAVNG